MGTMLRALVGGMVALACSAGPALATNGMNMIAFGGQEAGMAGASLAVSDNPMATNNNPAGLTQVKTPELTAGLEVLMPNLQHQDMFTGSVDGESNYFLLPMAAYAQPLGNGPWRLGLGLFAQGGMGAEFKNLKTAFGTTDQTYTNVGYAKLAPSVAYQVTPDLSLGLALNLGYSTMEMKFFPNTVAPGAFYGMNLQDVYAFGYGLKAGAQYKLNPMTTLGLVYTSRSQMDFKHGSMTFAGLGSYDAEVSGFNWPQSVGAGVALRPTSRWLLALDLTWVNWSEAMETVEIKTNSPLGTVKFPMEWKDQYVVALGAAYKLTEAWTLRAGYNYASNPVPQENLSPLFPAITEHHVTLGLGYRINQAWSIDGAWEHAFEKIVTYTNTGAPFGPNAEESHEQNTVSLFATVRF